MSDRESAASPGAIFNFKFLVTVLPGRCVNRPEADGIILCNKDKRAAINENLHLLGIADSVCLLGIIGLNRRSNGESK